MNPSSGFSMDRTRQAFDSGVRRGWHSGGQIYVSRNGNTLADLALGTTSPGGAALTPDHLMIWLSSTKPIAAVALAQLWQRGDLDLDDPVVRFLPAFGDHGKDRITLRHILTHTAGIRLLNIGWPKASWDETVEHICRARPEPRWVPGEKAGYHMASSWFILGAVIAEITGQPFEGYVREAIFEPLGMNRCWIGMNSSTYREMRDDIVPMHNTEGEEVRPYPWHKDPWVTRSNPGANGIGPLRQLGYLYEMLARRGRTAEGTTLLTPQSVEALTTPNRVGLFDHTFKFPLDWGLGLIINSRYHAAGDGGAHDEEKDPVPYGYGRHASRRTFGHSGRRSSTAFVDPRYGLVVALAVNGTPDEAAHRRRTAELTEAIYEDLDLVPSE